jgi:5-methylthioadenosine/S-adenosylhomocysteine deaminase
MNDPWEGMRYAMNAMRLRLQDPDSLPSAEALRLFTIGAAEAWGMGAEIGSLEAGKRADLIMLDLDRTHMQPFHGSYPALLWSAKISDVVASVIDGRVVLRDGQPVFAPQAEIVADIARRARRRDGDRVSLTSVGTVQPATRARASSKGREARYSGTWPRSSICALRR